MLQLLLSFGTLLPLFVSAAISTPPSTYFVKERTALPKGWSADQKHPASPKEPITLAIGLTQSNPTELERALLQISDPQSHTYAQYLTRDAVLALLRPTANTTRAVKSWLHAHTINTNSTSPTLSATTKFSTSPAQDWYTITLPVALAENLIGAKFTAYINEDSDERILRTLNYSIPSALQNNIDTIQPTTIFPLHQKNKKNGGSARGGRFLSQPKFSPSQFPNCTNDVASIVPPWCIKKLYNATGYIPASDTPGNSVAIAGYLDEYPQYAELEKYLKLYNPKAAQANYKFSIVSPTHTPVPQNTSLEMDTSEANLDVQIVAGMVYPIPSTFYSTSGLGSYNPDVNSPENSNEPYLIQQNYLLNLQDADLPSVLTTSYGDDEQSVSYAYALRVCRGYTALGARGVSVIVSSGDSGVGPFSSNDGDNECETNDGTQRTKFIPSFPATCWAVTTVGETQNISPEIAMSGSGGGFSNYFARPAYQDAAVGTYLKGWGEKYSSYFNNKGRGYPDIAAQGNRVPLFDAGGFTITFGTSCSAPMVASLVALLNDYRIRNGQPRLGFLNPLLYSQKAKSGINDILKGSNPGCGTDGFKAGKGWDPISGLGTLNFGRMKDVVVPHRGK